MMNNFRKYLEKVEDEFNSYIVNKIYKLDGKDVEYIGTKKQNPHITPEATDGDALIDKPELLFKWKEGNSSISSFGVKGHVIALGKKTAKKRIK